MSFPEKPSRSDTLTRLEELVTCAVCQEFLKNPKVFPCLHSYCYDCIVKLSKHECDLKCPECRTPIEIGSPPDLSKLPTNFFANNILATLSLRDDSEGLALLCSNCQKEDETVEKRCKDCYQFLCSPCAEFHQRTFDTKGHVLLSKDQLKGKKPAENAIPMKCSKHNELIKFYCDSCQESICMSCSILDHKQHKMVSVNESASEAKNEVQNLAEDVKKRMEKISAGIEAVTTTSKDIAAREEACKSQIEMFFAQLHAEIDDQKNYVLAMAESATDYQKNQVEALKKKLELSQSTCQRGVTFAIHTLEDGDDYQLLKLKPHIASQLNSLKHDEDKTTPDIGSPVRFLKDESLAKLFQEVVKEVCSAEEVTVCPEKCQAKVLDPIVKVGKKSSIIILCKDKEDRMINSGVGKDLIEPIFTGVRIQESNVSENKDGIHAISFVPAELGTVQFDAKINGYVSPGCSLKVDLQWELSNVHGNGYLGGAKHGQFNCMSGEGDVGTYSFRLGDTSMSSGVHQWNVEVSHAMQDAEECPEEGVTFEVGIIEAINDKYSEENVKNDTTKKWVYSGLAKKDTHVFLILDMGKKSLEILPGQSARKKFSIRRKTFEVKADSVFPFFSVNSPNYTLTFSK